MRDITKVKDIEIGLKVIIDSRNGAKEGIISKILTSKDNDKGIKVEIESGDKGRIIQILSEEPIRDKATKQKINVDEKIEKPIVIDIDRVEIANVDEKKLINMKNQRQFEVVTKFFQSTYCKSLKSDIRGIVIFKVKAIEVNIAIHKINIYLKKFCLSKDLKYEVIKVNSN